MKERLGGNMLYRSHNQQPHLAKTSTPLTTATFGDICRYTSHIWQISVMPPDEQRHCDQGGTQNLTESQFTGATPRQTSTLSLARLQFVEFIQRR